MSEEKNNLDEMPNGDSEEKLDGKVDIPTETDIKTEGVERTQKTVKLNIGALVISAVALILATVMVTFTVCNSIYRRELSERIPEKNGVSSGSEISGERLDLLTLLRSIIYRESIMDLDEEAMMEAVYRAYVDATGDRYAEYYNAEQYAALVADAVGENSGIGVRIVSDEIIYDGQTITVIRIVSVTKDTTAAQAGILAGDYIAWVGSGDEAELVDALKYDIALTKLKGEEGTYAEFTVLRPDGDSYEKKDFRIERKKFITESLAYHVCTTDKNVGIVRIETFNKNTPSEFSKAMDELIESGCTDFVFDVRGNLGGDLRSIIGVLSYFLEEGDVILSTKYKSGEESVYTASERMYDDESYANCNVRADEVGKYLDRGYEFAVLCNGSTASAAELFTANFRDHKLGTIVGTLTYGKGTVQSIYDLSAYGFKGALKLTNRTYYPPSGVGYDGIGIEPDDVEPLDEALLDKYIYDITDEEDNQLRAALEYFE